MPAQQPADAWSANLTLAADLASSRVSSKADGGTRFGDIVVVNGNQVKLTEHIYNTVFLKKEHYFMVPEEWAEAVLAGQIRAVCQSVWGFIEKHPSSSIALRAGNLGYSFSRTSYVDDGGGYVTDQVNRYYRWLLHTDEWERPVSTVDVFVGASE